MFIVYFEGKDKKNYCLNFRCQILGEIFPNKKLRGKIKSTKPYKTYRTKDFIFKSRNCSENKKKHYPQQKVTSSNNF